MKIEQLKQKEFDRRELELQKAHKQEYSYLNIEKKLLHITYVMTWTGICGGTKIILEHANRLSKRGHKITLVSHDKRPNWFEIDKQIDFIEVPWEEILCEKIPQCDLIVTTYWREIYEAIKQRKAPVIYFEQGDYHLFEPKIVEKRVEEFIKKQFETVEFIYTVSEYARKKIRERFGKDAIVIPNAVNDRVFFYEKRRENDNFTITIIGSQNVKFKRINNILKALKELEDEGYQFDVKWITPDIPNEKKGQNIEYIVNPQQIEIGNTLRKSDIYICASIYESFCLPVLEAMTCGATVITTNNGGNMDFVQDKKNALIIEKDNIEDIKQKVKMLYYNKTLREELAKNAYITSERYRWDHIILQIEDYYREISRYKII